MSKPEVKGYEVVWPQIGSEARAVDLWLPSTMKRTPPEDAVVHPLIRLTDHEAILDAMREDRDSQQRLCIDHMLINDELLGLLRELRYYVCEAQIYEREKFKGYEFRSDIKGIESDLARIDATLAKYGETK